jgi:zinc transport system ATP-binding protein
MKNNICLKLSDVSYSYQNQPVLENINLTIHQGDYVGIIGPNGGGKTTLIKIILGILKPKQGKMELSVSPIGYLPQKTFSTDYFFPTTVMEVMTSALNKKNPAALNKILQLMDLEQLKNKLISELSGGQRQRVFIARALVNEPKILILDEPTVGVDLNSQNQFYSFLKHLNQQLGISIIFVTHDLEIITQEASHIICLNKTMICHTHSKDFFKHNFLKKVYGDKMQLIAHRH